MIVGELAIVGAGAAGLCAAIAYSEAGGSTHLFTDRQLGTSNSVMAQGGLHVPFDTAASQRSMVEDIVRSGGPTADRAIAQALAYEALSAVTRLESWGLELNRTEDGEWERRLAGGMSEPRIVGTDRAIGPALIKVLLAKARKTPTIKVLEHTPINRITTTESGFRLESGGTTIGKWRAVIVATGGASFQRAQSQGELTSNPENRNEQGSDALTALGLETVDPHTYQWHPFGMVASSGKSRPVKTVPETIVEHGIELLDRHHQAVAPITAGRRALTEAAFLAARERRTIRDTGGYGHALRLTTSNLDPDFVRSHFRPFARNMRALGLLDANEVRDVLVWPVLHYQLGGYQRDPQGRTSQPGLFLAGELAGGLHGRNRLMGNGLTESVVTGFVAARSASHYLSELG